MDSSIQQINKLFRNKKLSESEEKEFKMHSDKD